MNKEILPEITNYSLEKSKLSKKYFASLDKFRNELYKLLKENGIYLSPSCLSIQFEIHTSLKNGELVNMYWFELKPDIPMYRTKMIRLWFKENGNIGLTPYQNTSLGDNPEWKPISPKVMKKYYPIIHSLAGRWFDANTFAKNISAVVKFMQKEKLIRNIEKQFK